MYKTARHSGKCGDILYSLPAAKALGVEVLYVPESTDQCTGLYSNMRSLLLQQSFIKEVREYPWLGGEYGKYNKDPNIHLDIDLDRHQEHLARGARNMLMRYADIFNVHVDQRRPWLTVEGSRLIEGDYNLISLTQRHRDGSHVNWKRVYEKIPKPVYFIGTVEEHEEFVEKYGEISRLYTADLLTFALYIKYCSALYTNQSCAVVIAQSISKKYYLEVKPKKTNCLFYTENENVLI
jgi:hypothetical protein